MAEATNENKDESDVRHPFLTGLRYQVYMFIDDNPYCTRKDISKGLGLAGSTATARVKELIDEGFVSDVSGMTKLNNTGVRARCLHVTTRQTRGNPLDKVNVVVELTIDCNGVYGARARVVGGKPQYTHATTIAKKTIKLTAPHPDTYSSEFAEEKVSRISRAEVLSNAELIIDG